MAETPPPHLINIGGHKCVLDPENKPPWRNYRCVDCHSRDSFHVLTCAMWADINRQFNKEGDS